VRMATKVRKRDARPMDPQCGKLVNPDRAIKLTLEGTSYFFCCEECRRRFEEAPPEDAGL